MDFVREVLNAPKVVYKRSVAKFETESGDYSRELLLGRIT